MIARAARASYRSVPPGASAFAPHLDQGPPVRTSARGSWNSPRPPTRSATCVIVAGSKRSPAMDKTSGSTDLPPQLEACHAFRR